MACSALPAYFANGRQRRELMASGEKRHGAYACCGQPSYTAGTITKEQSAACRSTEQARSGDVARSLWVASPAACALCYLARTRLRLSPAYCVATVLNKQRRRPGALPACLPTGSSSIKSTCCGVNAPGKHLPPQIAAITATTCHNATLPHFCKSALRQAAGGDGGGHRGVIRIYIFLHLPLACATATGTGGGRARRAAPLPLCAPPLATMAAANISLIAARVRHAYIAHARETRFSAHLRIRAACCCARTFLCPTAPSSCAL